MFLQNVSIDESIPKKWSELEPDGLFSSSILSYFTEFVPSSQIHLEIKEQQKFKAFAWLVLFFFFFW